MDSKQFDSIVKSFGTGASRRRVLQGATATALGALGLGLGQAAAAPRTCTTCVCGTGRPCNPKSTTCTEARAFAAEQSCTEACKKRGQRLCSLGNSFHCPRGCPA